MALTLVLAASPPAGAARATGGLPTAGWFIDQARFKASAHGGQGCSGCHAAEQAGTKPKAAKPHPDPDDPRYLRASAREAFDYSYCGNCHSVAVKRHGQGKHAEAKKKHQAKPPAPGAYPAPTCAHCHNPHTVTARRDRLAVGRWQVRVCGSCHPTQAASYLQTYHGKAAFNLGLKKAAFCSDCHGAHSIRSLKKPAAALHACRRCHRRATQGFASVVMHPSPQAVPKEDKPLSRRVAIITTLSSIMAVVALVVVLAFYSHGLLWALRELQEKIRRRR